MKPIFTALLACAALSAPVAASATGYAGEQWKGISPTQQAELKCGLVQRTVPGTITNVSLNGTGGFWLATSAGGVFRAFPDGRAAVNFVIPAGTYYLCPDAPGVGFGKSRVSISVTP